MNPVQIGGIIRAILAWAAGYGAARGVIPETWVADIVGLGVVIGVGIWSYYTNKTTTMISSVAESDKVAKVIVTEPEIAHADPSPKVVPLHGP